MPRVDLYSWNPRRPLFRGPVGRLVPLHRRVDNFGDVLGPALVSRMLRAEGLRQDSSDEPVTTLYSIGSVMHMVKSGDHVWGTGVNGKEISKKHDVVDARFHAVRGHLTRNFLQDLGVRVPEVFGDPGILTSVYFPRADLPEPLFHSDVTIVPNLHDYRHFAHLHNALNPRLPLLDCLSTIASSKFVVGSSLHGLVVAESFGVPARRMVSAAEPDFKYEDYYSGTGRTNQTAAISVEDALDLGEPQEPDFDKEGLTAAFPRFLWDHRDSESK
ncbi:polysaccharide pyruvyl transferase family protein [Zhihengliuella somnathii]